MDSLVDAGVVYAKIVTEGAAREADYDDESSVWFSVVLRDKKRYFQIPQPLEDGGYSLAQLEAIEFELSKLGLDLLPLDHNLLC